MRVAVRRTGRAGGVYGALIFAGQNSLYGADAMRRAERAEAAGEMLVGAADDQCRRHPGTADSGAPCRWRLTWRALGAGLSRSRSRHSCLHLSPRRYSFRISLSWGNTANLLQRNSIIGIVACGMLLMIILGGFDLSVGAVGAMPRWSRRLPRLFRSQCRSASLPRSALGLLVGLVQRTVHRQDRHQSIRGDSGDAGCRDRDIVCQHSGAAGLRRARESFTVARARPRSGRFPIPALIFAAIAHHHLGAAAFHHLRPLHLHGRRNGRRRAWRG